MPTVANGIEMDWHVTRSRAENLELEMAPASRIHAQSVGLSEPREHGQLRRGHPGYLSGHDAVPDMDAYRAQGRVKTGLGLNLEDTLPRDVRMFARSGWNEGHNESFAYTEVNDSVQGGGDVVGQRWGRPTIAWESPSSPTVCQGPTASIWHWAARVSCWGMER